MLRRNERYMTKNVYWSSSKVPAVLVRFSRNLNFIDISPPPFQNKNIKKSNLLKIRSVGVVMFHAAGGGGGEGRTDRRRPDRYDAVNRRFSQSCESAPPQKKKLTGAQLHSSNKVRQNGCYITRDKKRIKREVF